MAKILIEHAGSVVNGVDHGSLGAAQGEVNRLMQACGHVDPERIVWLDIEGLCEARLLEGESGGLLVLVEDPGGQWTRLSEHGDSGSARAAFVRALRDAVKVMAAPRFDAAVARLRSQAPRRPADRGRQRG